MEFNRSRRIMNKCICIVYLVTSHVVAQNVTVNLNTVKQTIRGFGGMNHKVWTGYDLSASDRDLAFGNGPDQIGMSILRFWISNNENQWSTELATAKDVIARGGIVFATPWNPPANLCDTVSRNNRQEKRLKPDSYGAYVEHLNKFTTYMKNNGVNLHAISFANEPDYGKDWTWWSVDEVYNFTKNNASALNAERVITAESFAYSKKYYDKILNDGAALKNVDIIGAHFYASDATSPDSWFQYPLFEQKGNGKELWMTEHYTESKNDADLWPLALDVGYEIHRALAVGNFNAYVWWYIRRDYGPIKNSTGKISKRGYLMAQFSKYIRPGYVRVDATVNPATDVHVSAYKGKDSVIVVAVNRSTSSKTITISIPGTTVKSFAKITTSGSKNLGNDGPVTVTSNSCSVTLDAQSVTTLAGTGTTVGINSEFDTKYQQKVQSPFTADGFYIRVDGQFSYRITTIQGAVMELGSGSNARTTGLHLTPGVYLLDVQHATGNFKKVLVKK